LSSTWHTTKNRWHIRWNELYFQKLESAANFTYIKTSIAKEQTVA
jgi:hypothetical protein